MAKGLYSEVVSGRKSNDDEINNSTRYRQLHWLDEYEIEDEDVALQKVIDLSKVTFAKCSYMPFLILIKKGYPFPSCHHKSKLIKKAQCT